MSNEEDKQEKRGFKVEDRRRFSETGEARSDVREETPGPAPSAAAQATQRHEPPPLDINFSTFIISLSTQALAHLGEIPHPIDDQVAVDLGAAKQLIDILGVLKDKTKGNLDPSESGLLDSVLYDLRLKYVERVRSRPDRIGS